MAIEGRKTASKKPSARRKTPARSIRELQAEAEVAAPQTVKLEPKELRSESAARAAAAPRSMFAPTRLRHRDVNAFLRQLIMLMDAGTPILKSLHTCALRSEKAAVRSMVADIAQHVENGNALWQGFERHPESFDTVFVNLIKASEASGTLAAVLKRQVEYREHREMLARKLRGAMLYPAVLLVFCVGVLLLISKYVIPEFEKTFLKLGDGELPEVTKFFFGAMRFITSLQFVIGLAAIVIGSIVLYKFWVSMSPLNRLRADRWKLHLPYIGKSILRKRAIVEFTWSLSMMLRSGMSMMVTLELVRTAINNRAVGNALQAVRDSVERGEGMEAPLRAVPGIIPPVVTDMLVTGEESGQLDDIAEHIARTYEEEVEIAVASLGDLLLPVMVIFIGGMVLVLFVALFLPLIAALDQLMSAG